MALKVLRAELSADETFRRRFVHEARAAGEVRHKHLMPITDAGETEGRPYLAVAFVRGQTLEARLAQDGPLPIQDMVRVVAHVASVLQRRPCQPSSSTPESAISRPVFRVSPMF